MSSLGVPWDFIRSVNPISIRRGRLCPPHYYWHPRIFRPSYGPVRIIKRSLAFCCILQQVQITSKNENPTINGVVMKWARTPFPFLIKGSQIRIFYVIGASTAKDEYANCSSTYTSIPRVNYDTNGTLCKSKIFLVAKLFLASLCLVRDPNHQSNDRCWRVRKSLIFAKRKYRLISYIRHNVLNSFWKEHSFFHFQMFPQYIYQNTHIL